MRDQLAVPVYAPESDECVFVNYAIPPRSPLVHAIRRTELAIKYILFIYNVIFTLKTLAQVGISIWLKTNQIQTATMLLLRWNTSHRPTMPYFYECTLFHTWLSVCALAVGFFSCRFSLVRYRSHLKIYVLMMTVIFLGEMIIVILAILTRNQMGKIKTAHIKATLTSEIYLKNTEIRKSWDVLQSYLQCCGAEGPVDYTAVFKDHNGCVGPLIWEIEEVMAKIVGTSSGFSILQWIGMAFGSTLIYLNMEYRPTF